MKISIGLLFFASASPAFCATLATATAASNDFMGLHPCNSTMSLPTTASAGCNSMATSSHASASASFGNLVVHADGNSNDGSTATLFGQSLSAAMFDQALYIPGGVGGGTVTSRFSVSLAVGGSPQLGGAQLTLQQNGSAPSSFGPGPSGIRTITSPFTFGVPFHLIGKLTDDASPAQGVAFADGSAVLQGFSVFDVTGVPLPVQPLLLPEPSSAAFLAVGLVLAGFARRRLFSHTPRASVQFLEDNREGRKNTNEH